MVRVRSKTVDEFRVDRKVMRDTAIAEPPEIAL